MPSLEDEFAFRSVTRRPKCLAGISIMLVDDSRSVSEAVRMMAVRSGARIRRADCVASSSRHLMLFRPDVVIIDLSLPDGSGVEVARNVVEALDQRPGLLILSAACEEEAKAAALEAEADNYLLKPIESIGAFQAAVLNVLPGGADVDPEWGDKFAADISSHDVYAQDLENVLDLLEEAVREGDRESLVFGAQFLAGSAATAGDDALVACASGLRDRVNAGHPGQAAAKDAISTISTRLKSGLAQAS